MFFPLYKVERIPVEHVSMFRFKELCFAEVQSVRLLVSFRLLYGRNGKLCLRHLRELSMTRE